MNFSQFFVRALRRHRVASNDNYFMIFEKPVTDSIESVGFLNKKINFRPKKNFLKFQFLFLDPKFRKIFFESKINFFSKKTYGFDRIRNELFKNHKIITM